MKDCLYEALYLTSFEFIIDLTGSERVMVQKKLAEIDTFPF